MLLGIARTSFVVFMVQAQVGILPIGNSATPASGQSVTIMPFGDSVTSYGSAPESSYRYWLYTYLTNDYGDIFSFVGSQYGIQDGTPANNWPQQSFEGGAGWTTQDGVDDMNIGTPQSYNPEIVLLDLGANDVDGGNIDTGTTTANLETIIQAFVSVNPNLVILMADPTPWVASDQTQRAQMSRLKGAVANAAKAEKAAGVNVTVVNLWSGFSPNKDTKDGAHPNVQGEQRIAKKFFDALKPVLAKDFGMSPARRH